MTKHPTVPNEANAEREILFLNLSAITVDDTAEGEVVGASVDRMGHAGGGAVALAVVLGAGPGAPFEHLGRDSGSGRTRIDAALTVAATRINRSATAGTAHVMLGGGEERDDRPPGKIVLTCGLRRLLDFLATEAILADDIRLHGPLPPRIAALLGHPDDP